MNGMGAFNQLDCLFNVITTLALMAALYGGIRARLTAKTFEQITVDGPDNSPMKINAMVKEVDGREYYILPDKDNNLGAVYTKNEGEYHLLTYGGGENIMVNSEAAFRHLSRGDMTNLHKLIRPVQNGNKFFSVFDRICMSTSASWVLNSCGDLLGIAILLL